MELDDILLGFADLTSDALMVGFRSSMQAPATVVYVNPAFVETFGYTPEEVIDGPATVTLAPDQKSSVFAQLSRHLAAGDDRFTLEKECCRKDRSTFWSAVSYRVFYRDDGSLLIVAAHRDVSDLRDRERRAELALQERDKSLATARAAQDRLVAALESYPNSIAIFDRERRLVQCNSAYKASVARHPEQIRAGMHITDILRNSIEDGLLVCPDNDPEGFIDKIIRSAEHGVTRMDLELAGDRHERTLRSRSANGDYVIIRVNTTELVRERRAAEQSQARLMSAINAYPAPFSIYDAHGVLLVFNEPYARAYSDDPSEIRPGLHVREVLATGIRNKRFPAAAGREQAWIEEMLKSSIEADPFYDIELAGDIHHRVLCSRADNGDVLFVRLDTTELVRQQREVEEYARMLEAANSAILHEAVHDQLTGLGNRRFLQERFAELSQRRRREGGEIAVLHIDLDRFKQINDTIGHAAGDHVLVEVSKRLGQALRSDDVATRIGGDEFVVLLYLTDDPGRPEALADRLLTSLCRPTVYEGRECRFGASIGIATTMVTEESTLLAESDIALYKAKRAGRAQVAVFNRADMDEMRRIKVLADDILRGIEQREFVPYFQPQVDATTGRIVGLEALARWMHPEHGVVGPGSFIATAGDLNVARDIDFMIFEKSIADCAQALGMMADPPGLSFNLSIRSVLTPDLDRIRDLVAQFPGPIAFELLETIFLEEADTTFLMQLDRFREMGLSIDVDDFGSGRASIVALQRISPDRLKIDRRLIEPLAETQSARQLVRSIIEIGRALQIGVTAEGVETAAQAGILASLGCDRLQGYHFAPPLPLDEVVQMIRAQERRDGIIDKDPAGTRP